MASGGKIAPDGRPPVAPGVGKTARRHDLEAPATPGLSDPSIQQGDVQRLENAQKVAPIAGKRTQAPATGQNPTRRRQGANRGSDQFAMAPPDPVDMAGDRLGGSAFAAGGGEPYVVDPAPWMPLLEQMAATPNAGGGLTSAFVEQLSAFRREPVMTQSFLIDLNEADEALGL